MQTSRKEERLGVVMFTCNPNTQEVETRRPLGFPDLLSLPPLGVPASHSRIHGRACLTKQGRWHLRTHPWGYPLVSKCRSTCRQVCLFPPCIHTHTHRKLQRDPIEYYLTQHPPGATSMCNESGDGHSAHVIWMKQPDSSGDPLLVGGRSANPLPFLPDSALSFLCGIPWRIHL